MDLEWGLGARLGRDMAQLSLEKWVILGGKKIDFFQSISEPVGSQGKGPAGQNGRPKAL